MRKGHGYRAALALLVLCGCRVGGDEGQSRAPAPSDLTGTYTTSAEGHNLGKDWSYSGALVLDSTRHFGLTLTVADNEKPPQRTSINGSYEISRQTSHVNGRSRSLTRVTLSPEGERHREHPVLVVSGDTLRYSGPWWFNAGLSALGIADPVLARVSHQVSPDSSVAASSTAVRKATIAPAAVKR